MKYLPIWSEAFLITALVWTFSPVFNKTARKRLSEGLKERILAAKSDFGTYQKSKKKQAMNEAVKVDDKGSSFKDSSKLSGAETGPQRSQTAVDSIGKNRLLMRKITKKLNADGFQKITPVGLTSEFDSTRE